MESSKTFQLDQVKPIQKTVLIDIDKIIKSDDDTARVLNTLFSNIFRDLKIPDYNNCDQLAENIQQLILKGIVKYKNHTSIVTIGEVCKKNPQFCLKCADKNEI